ncbi:MAG: putative C-S lyase [Chloroflexi bacterium]|nr:putative C-S lyase [Chloroflexota bacterium]
MSHIQYDFDCVIERRSSGSAKWNKYDADVLPMWVADTDFPVPQPVIDALHARLDHPLFGYQFASSSARDAVVDYVQRRYGWQIAPEDVIFAPNLIAAINQLIKVIGVAGHEVLLLPPIYPPFIAAPPNFGHPIRYAQMTLTSSGQRMRYEIDFDALEAAITPATKLLIMSSPHNPTGRTFSRAEQERLAEFCLRHGIRVISDEIHCDLILEPEIKHVPFATVSPEAAANTVTLMSPSKTFNMPGLQASFGIVTDKTMRAAIKAEQDRYIVPGLGALSWVALEAALRHGDDYREQLVPYLRANRDVVLDFVERELPGVKVTVPEATFLAWLDFRDTSIGDDPFTHLLERGRVALNDGKTFGPGGGGFARLNFGCPRVTLLDGLERIKRTLAG